MIYLKTFPRPSETGQADLRAAVEDMPAEPERDGDAAAIRFARNLDQQNGEIVMSPEARPQAAAQLSANIREDIRCAHRDISRFAEAQRATNMDCKIEILPGLLAG